MVIKEREAGFAIANIATSFAHDPRVRRMREALPFGEYTSAVGLYLLLALASWREARRVDLYEEFTEPRDQDVRALRRYGLVDHQFRIRRAAFNHYVGKAIRNRAASRDFARDRQRRLRTNLIPSDSPRSVHEELSRVTDPDSNGATGGISTPSTSPRHARVTRDSSKQERDVGNTNVISETDEIQDDARARESAAADEWVVVASAVEELTGQAYALASPHSRLGQMALELARDKGVDATLGAFKRAALMVDGHPSAGQIVLGASNLLRPIPSGSRVAAGGSSGDRGHTRPVEEVEHAFNRSRS